jgi:glycosyltransferase involved in cell wall biosynthesis
VTAADPRPLVVIDADVLGRQRTGDETYVRNLLRTLPAAPGAEALRFAAVTRRPDLVPPGIEAVALAARSQEWRMAVTLPRLLRRLRPALAHFQYALPLRCPCPAVVTIHDLSFERDPGLMSLADRCVFKLTVPRAARRARRVLTVSERTRHDIEELYGVLAARIVVTPNGVDPVFTPAPPSDHVGAASEPAPRGLGAAPAAAPARPYLLFVGAIQERKDPLAALAAAEAVGLPLVVVGPEKDPAIAAELRRRGADLRGYVERADLAALYRGAAALVFPSRFEGFGLPLVEAMACGTPVVAVPEPALLEVAGGAAVFVPAEQLADGVRRALAERDTLVAAGLDRARHFSWERTAALTVAAYLEAIGR